MHEVKKFSFDIGIVFIVSMINLLFNFFINVILARTFGPEDLGLYRMISTVYGIIMLLGTLAIPAAIIKFVAESKEDKGKINNLISSGIATSIIIGIGCSLALFLLSGWIAAFFNMPGLSILLQIVSLIFPFALFGGVMSGFLIGLREMKKYGLAFFLQSFFMLTSTISLIYFFGFGVSGAVISFVLASVSYALILLYFSRKEFTFTIHYYYATLKMIINFSLPVIAGSWLGEISKYFDVLFVGYYLTATDLGYYSVAVILSNYLYMIPLAFQKITFPATSTYWSQNNHAKMNKMVNQSMKYCTLALIISGLFTLFFGNYVITIIFKKDFLMAFVPLQIMLVAIIIRGGLLTPIGSCLVGIGKPGIDLKMTIINTIITLTLDVLLIPKFGIIGAATATAISLIIGTLIGLFFIKKYVMIEYDTHWFLKVFLLLISSILLFKLGTLFFDTLLLGIFFISIDIFILYIVFLTEEDIKFFKSLANMIKNQRE